VVAQKRASAQTNSVVATNSDAIKKQLRMIFFNCSKLNFQTTQNYIMTQIANTNGVKSDTLSRFCNPHEIRVPESLFFDEAKVLNIVKAFESQGIVPEIIVSHNLDLLEGINALEASKRLNQEIILASIKSGEHLNKFRLITVDLLDIHPLNTSIYGEEEDLTELTSTIKATGWIEPLLVTPSGDASKGNFAERFRVISGNSRLKVCRKLDIKEVYCDVKIFSLEAKEIKALLAGNVAREKSIEQKVREGWLWEKIEREEAHERQKMGKNLPENFPEGKCGDVRDIVAKRVGLGSGKTYEHATAAVKELDKSKDAPTGTVRGDRHQQLKELLSKPKGVDAAYKLVAERPTPKAKKEVHQEEKWLPNELDRICITGGDHKGKLATVRVKLTFHALCHLDGTPEGKRVQIGFDQMKLLDTEKPTSVTEELRSQQQDLGLGTGEQIFPSIPPNTEPVPERMPSSLINLNVVQGDALVVETAIALSRLTPEQINQAISKASMNWDKAQIEAAYSALHQSSRVVA
jgi:ParB-like chromosome segregation protein Spo0J